VQLKKGLLKLVGLHGLKEMAMRDIVASRILNERFPNTGLFGISGVGKSFFAEAVAEELGYHFFQIEGSTVATKKELVELLCRADDAANNRGARLLFFVDEAHRLGKLQEVLYYPMTKWYIATKEGFRKFAPFTVFAATTHPHMLLPSFMSRLSNQWHLDRYSHSEIYQVVESEFSKHHIHAEPYLISMITQRCLGIPRLATNLALKIRNEVIHRSSSDGSWAEVTEKDCYKTFDIENIDEIGLRSDHVSYLQELYSSEAPKGIGSIAGKLGLDEEVVSGTIEPVLLELHMIDLTNRGRIITERGIEHLKTCHT
jgi:Holliday junction DNA helicase RuvB